MEFKGRIVVYSIVGCPHCKAAKTKLADMKLPYIDVNLDEYPDFRKPMMELSHRRTVPQIFFNSKHIGGNDEFQKLSEDELEKLIEDVKNNPPIEDSPPVPDLVNGKDDTASGAQEDVKDENADLVDAFKLSGIIKDHRYLLTVHRKSFQGLELVKWLEKDKEMDTETALETGKKLLEYHFLSAVRGEETFKNDSTLYRLLRDEPSNALNATVDSNAKPANASDLSIQIRKKILQLYGDYLSADGKCVDYEGIKKSDLFRQYVQLTGQLQRVSLDALTKNEKLAFFINIYNALVIHGNVELGFPSSLWQRYKFFNTVCYRIGGLNYSLQDIENGILRANRKGVGMLTRPFSKSDPRLKVALDYHEPKIHFALVCGAKSCPPIKTYTADNVDEQLQCAAESFLEGDDGCVLDSKKKIIKLTKILDWYRVDFGNSNEKVVEWVCSTLPNCQKKDELANTIKENNFKVSFMAYDWGSNKK